MPSLSDFFEPTNLPQRIAPRYHSGMVIVEGPDGAGKTTLIQHLCQKFELPLHKRFSDSKQGPLGDMFAKGMEDILTWPTQALSVYDRHPFISQPIYNPIVRKVQDSRFWGPEGRALFHDLVNNSIVIFCDPGLEHIEKNLTDEGQMDGVTKHIRALHGAYAMTLARWPRLEPMLAVKYDYNREADLIRVEAMVDYHITHGGNRSGKR